MNQSSHEKRKKIFSAFPKAIAEEVLSLLLGNTLAITSPNDLNDHTEQGIVVGDNLNWLINDKDLHLFGVSGHVKEPEQSFTVACTILQENILNRRIDPKNGLVFAVVLSAHTHESFERKKKRLPSLIAKYSEMIKPFAHIAQHDAFQIVSSVFCVETSEVFIQNHLGGHDSRVSVMIAEKINTHINLMNQLALPHLPALVVECMDPRVCLCTHTNFRAHRVLRSAGAKDVTLEQINRKLGSLMNYATRKRTTPIIISTYHFSEINPFLGCRGHSTVEQARNNAFNIKNHAVNLGVDSVVLVVNTDKKEVGVHTCENEVVFSSEIV